MAAADDDYLLNPDYERRKRELENVANALTQDVLEYWSQNTSLRVNPDIDKTTVTKPNGQTTVIDELKIRIWDDKHFLSLPFNEHSTGFQWFFSFLAAFSEYEYKDEPVIILLDEPGLGLHGKAQADFLRFIEERLAPKRQVIYTTHSPFMVQPNKLERARIVEEKSRDEGSKVTSDVLTTDPDTLFPLQGALGYDLAQHMFISKNNLILEGTSDYTYIIAISDYLIEKGRHGLRPDWTLIPVGGADLIPTFVALLGIHLDLTVVVDARKEGNQKNRLPDRELI
jgi:predicted ATP-dependent endonuclease of OLD family